MDEKEDLQRYRETVKRCQVQTHKQDLKSPNRHKNHQSHCFLIRTFPPLMKRISRMQPSPFAHIRSPNRTFSIPMQESPACIFFLSQLNCRSLLFSGRNWRAIFSQTTAIILIFLLQMGAIQTMLLFLVGSKISRFLWCCLVNLLRPVSPDFLPSGSDTVHLVFLS